MQFENASNRGDGVKKELLIICRLTFDIEKPTQASPRRFSTP